MKVFNKILTALRGSVRELGETVVDANATRIYEQEVVDAKHNLQQARHNLTEVMAKEMQTARAIERLRGEVERYEGLAVEALNKEQPGLAEEVAARIAAVEDELSEQTRAHGEYAANVERLKQLIRDAENKIREHERELAMAKTAESVYKATQSISDSMHGGSSKLVSARESLERIKQRHQDLADRMAAAETLEHQSGAGSLERKLAAAGIGAEPERAAAIMERIRARRAAADGGDER